MSIETQQGIWNAGWDSGFLIGGGAIFNLMTVIYSFYITPWFLLLLLAGTTMVVIGMVKYRTTSPVVQDDKRYIAEKIKVD